MITFRTLLLAWAALISAVPRMVMASPRGAGGCAGGMAAVGASHLTATTLQTGSLQDFGITLLLNGDPLDAETTHDIPIGMDHTWELVASSNDTAFRGFLLRLDGGTEGIDTTAALSGKGGRVQVAETVCVETEGVGGVTHTSRRLETNVSGSLRLDELSDDMNLDVTVVARNRNDVSIFYYSAFVFSSSGTIPAEMEVEEVDTPVEDEDTAVEEEAGTEGGENMEPETEEVETVVDSTPSPTVVESIPSPTPLDEADDDDDDEGTDPTPRPTRKPTSSPVAATGAPTGIAILPPTNEAMVTGTPTAGTAAPSIMNEGGDDDEDIQMETQKEQEAEVEENLQQSFPLLASMSPSCSRNDPCSVCQGDCNMDSDCEGELACFQRDEWDETPVPGCSGRGIMGTDYCFDPLLHPNGLREFTSACTTAEPCGKCQGDCDGDSQCFGDLECFQRPGSSNMTVPGCIGLGSPGRDYCFDRSDLETSSGMLTEEVETTAPTEASETMQENEPMKEEEEDASFPLTEEVETPAPTDASEPVQEDEPMNEEEEEEGPLEPVEEEEATDAPTAASEPAQEDEPTQEQQEEAMGGGENDEATIEPTTELTSELSLEPPSTPAVEEPLGDEFVESEMSLQQSTCSSANPCGICEGDCDVDEDCEGDTECFARWGQDTNSVPGCDGEGFPGWDYCFSPAEDLLRPRITPCSAESPCKKCQADCDGDQDCQGNLKCFYRDDNDGRAVPGCQGTPIANIDYCFDPSDLGERRALRARAN